MWIVSLCCGYLGTAPKPLSLGTTFNLPHSYITSTCTISLFDGLCRYDSGLHPESVARGSGTKLNYVQVLYYINSPNVGEGGGGKAGPPPLKCSPIADHYATCTKLYMQIVCLYIV